jgi:hypothetical protein
MPLIPRLRLQYRNPSRAKALKAYRQSLFQISSGQAEVRDFFDGDLFREFHMNELGLFDDTHDVALHMSLDGVQVTNMRNHEITPVILMNLNLPPDERYHVKNILASLLIPGPKKPKVIDTFLRPLVDELLLLDKGVPAFDGNTRTAFQLRAWVTMVTGDGPALADAIGMKRPGNALRPCRTCEIKAERGGAKSKTYYVPHTNYDFSSPPLRSDLRDIIKLVDEADSEEYRKRTGVSRSSILLELQSLHFPRSFPADIMHLVLQNIAPLLYQLWNRTKLAIDDRNHSNFAVRPYHLDDAAIEAISSALANARGEIPTYLGHAPRRINNHYKGYKAAEWEAWLKLFGVPLLDQRLNEAYVENFRTLSRIYTLATRHSLIRVDIDLLEVLVLQFVRSFEDLYFGGDPQKLPVCSVNIHYLLHFPLYIRDCGPARYWWQFPMERFCGILKPKARSKSQLSASAANALVIAEQLNHIRFIRLKPVVSPIQYPILHGRYEACLAPYQRNQLNHTYGEISNIAFFKRCQLCDSLIIGSIQSQRRGDITRCNYRICYSRPDSDQMEFGIVHYFVRANQGQQVWQLAWVRQLEDVDIDCAKRIASYGREGSHFWIDIAWINSLIGIVREGGVNLIVTDVDLFD